MGDYYFLKLNCAYCQKENYPDNSDGGVPDGVYYAPSSEVKTFKCDYCGKENKIELNFYAKKTNKKTKQANQILQ